MIDLSRTTGEQLFFRLLTAPDGLGVKAIFPSFQDLDLRTAPDGFPPHSTPSGSPPLNPLDTLAASQNGAQR